MVAAAQKTLVGWKSIAGYLSRDERTVMRWAASRGMPVQRVPGQARSSVYAWTDDLDAWLRCSDPLTPIMASAATDSAVIGSPGIGSAGIGSPGIGSPGIDSAVLDRPAVATLSATNDLMPARVAPQSGLQASARASLWRRWTVWVALVGLLCTTGFLAVALAAPNRKTADQMPAPPSASAFHDPAARASYLQGSFDWNLRTRDSLSRAISEYGDAVARDPGIAASYVGLANTYLLMREYAAMPDAEAYARARAAAKIAIELDPKAMEAKRALAFIAFWRDGDIPEAKRQFGAALALAPNDPLTHHWLATALSANGEQEAAMREISIARSLDPASSSILIDFGLIAYRAGKHAESARVFSALVKAVPGDASLYRNLATIALYEGRYQDYLGAAARAATLRDDAAGLADINRQARDYAQGSAPLMFEHMVNAARERTLRSNSGYFRLAEVSAISGRNVAAVDALAPACTQKDPDAVGAAGDLWLSRALSASQISQLCGRASLAPDQHMLGSSW